MDKFLSKLKLSNNKKQIENIVIFIVLLIIVIIVINSLFAETSVQEENNPVDVTSDEIANDDLEKKLERILSLINGVGDVDVMISYTNTIEQVPMYDLSENVTVTQEEDVNGGKRETKETNNEQKIIYEEKNNTKIPAIKQTIMPEVIGVIVVAEGANNSVVKENVKNAVEAVVNIPSHRIQVFAK